MNFHTFWFDDSISWNIVTMHIKLCFVECYEHIDKFCLQKFS